ALVFVDRRVRRVGAEHAQAFAHPAEPDVVPAGRRGADLQRRRQQRVGAGGEGGREAALFLRPRRTFLGLRDAGGGDRVAAQVVGGALLLAAAVAAFQRLHALEHVRHRLGVVAAARERADADAVCFGLVAARVVDLALRGDAL